MFSPLSGSHLSRSFLQLYLHRALELNAWSSIPCAHGIPRSILGERRLTTSTEETYRKKLHVPSFIKLRTLRPERLSIVGQEAIDLSGKVNPGVPMAINGTTSVPVVYEWEHPKSHNTIYKPFPKNTKGFFYFGNAPGKPELCAGVRFRICDSPTEFEHGRDLLNPRGDVWGYKVVELLKHKSQEGFLSLLRAENLLDEELINDINKLDLTQRVRRYQYSLSDSFYLNVGYLGSEIKYITRAKLVQLRFPEMIFVDQSGYSRVKPLGGLIKVQFELSNLPEHKKLGPTLVIRVLHIIKPITVDPLYDRNKVPVPVPGTLLYRFLTKKKRVICIPLMRQPMADDLLELMKISWG